MVDNPTFGAGEHIGQPTEVKLIKDVSPKEFAAKTGGLLVHRGSRPWNINYAGGDILWAGFPRRDKDEASRKLPWLNGNHLANGTVGTDAAIISDSAITLVSPGLGAQDKIIEYVFSNGQFEYRTTPIDQASSDQLKARELAREETLSFMNGNPVRIKEA